MTESSYTAFLEAMWLYQDPEYEGKRPQAVRNFVSVPVVSKHKEAPPPKSLILLLILSLYLSPLDE